MGTVIPLQRAGEFVTRLFKRREADPHVVEMEVEWIVTTQLARVSRSARMRIIEHVAPMLEERDMMGLTPMDGDTCAPPEYVVGKS